MFIILAVAICTSAQQIGVQKGVLIERPRGIAIPLIQPTGLKANLPELRQKNADFYQFISSGNIGLFQPARNESTVRKFTIDNILFHRDDRINFVPNTPRTVIERVTIKPATQYSLRRPQSFNTFQSQSLIESPKPTFNQLGSETGWQKFFPNTPLESGTSYQQQVQTSGTEDHRLPQFYK